ncbi:MULTISPECIES: methylated-DNA--[protein]-cysteine S-methyltransferase [Pseudomonas]|nr:MULTISPECIES: MGMT family protein [Pseudomonas]
MGNACHGSLRHRHQLRSTGQEHGQTDAARAIGMANAVNPISIIVPCHRVIAAKGKLSGYSGGLDKKRDLLPLEAEHTRVDLLQAAFS